VVDLTQIKLATTEDRTRHRDLWAAFFKAKSWEELKMLAQQDKNIEQAATITEQAARIAELEVQLAAKQK
jgi:hypothetical protein